MRDEGEVEGLWLRATSGEGLRVKDSGFKIQDSGFRIQDSGFKIHCAVLEFFLTTEAL